MPDETIQYLSGDVPLSRLPDTEQKALLSSIESIEHVATSQTSTLTASNQKSEAASNQRLRYERNELLRIRDTLGTLPMPPLPDIDIVLRQTDNSRLSHPPYANTNTQRRRNNPDMRQ
ncbi:hypothetical protein I4U23_005360 [Adineta vaga]|nr:hypothetical protein I4U23_005360 [Adineta vaga]